MRQYYIAFLLIAAFTLNLASYAAAKDIEFTLSFDKEEYTLKDPIYVTFTLKNTGKKPVYVNKRFNINPQDSPKEYREVFLTVISPSGEELPYKPQFYETGFPKSDYFVLLNKGEEASLDRKRNIKGYFEFKDPGTYEITATYQNVYGGEIGVDAFKGKIKSKEMKLKIIE